MDEKEHTDNQEFVGKNVKVTRGVCKGFVGIVIQQNGLFIKIYHEPTEKTASTRIDFVKEIK